MHLSLSNGFVFVLFLKIDTRDDVDMVFFPFLDGDNPRRLSYGLCISQLIRFTRVCSHVDYFNACN